MWQDVGNITDDKQSHSTPILIVTSLPDQLNTFFASFENNSNKGLATCITPPESDQPLSLRSYQVELLHLHGNQEVGPDSIPGHALKA